MVLATLPSLGAGGESPEAPPQSWTQLWLFRFLLNVAGYASFMVPGYLLVQYLRRKNYLETGNVAKGWGNELNPVAGVGRLGGRPVSQTAGRAGRSGEAVDSTYVSSSGRGLCFPLVKACVFGNEPKAPDEVLLAPRTETAESTPSWQVLKLVFCASGLQVRRQAPLLLPSWVQTARHLMKPNLPCPPQIVGSGMVYAPTGHSLILKVNFQYLL